MTDPTDVVKVIEKLITQAAAHINEMAEMLFNPKVPRMKPWPVEQDLADLRDIVLRLATSNCDVCGKRDNLCEECGHTKESHILRVCDRCEENVRLKEDIAYARKLIAAGCDVNADISDENTRLKADAKKTASLQEASRFYRVCDVCHTSSFETTPTGTEIQQGERCGYCRLKAEVERLHDEKHDDLGHFGVE